MEAKAVDFVGCASTSSRKQLLPLLPQSAALFVTQAQCNGCKSRTNGYDN